jgi:peptidylprolyl isomerase
MSPDLPEPPAGYSEVGSPSPGRPGRNRILGAIAAVAAIVAVVAVVVMVGSGEEEPESEDVLDPALVAAVSDVEGGEVSRADYDRAMEQAAARLGLAEVPRPTADRFEQLNDEAMQGLLLEIWAEGEALDRGIEVTEVDVQAELEEIENSFKNPEEFARVAEQSKFCTEDEIADDVPTIECADVVRQGRLLALQRALSDAFAESPASDEEVQQEFIDKWTARTRCQPEVLMQFCSEFDEGKESAASADPPAGEPPVDLSTKPVIAPREGAPPDRLEVTDVVVGDGAEARSGDEVEVQYVGAIYGSGEEFDSSWDRGEPFVFELGAGSVIPGWDKGIQGMKVGGRRELVIPPELAYGAQGQPPDIGPDETLVFVVDLLGVG